MSDLTVFEITEKVLEKLKSGRFEKAALDGLKLVSVSPDKVVCTMVVEEKHLNVAYGLHGGVIASLVDVVSSLAVIAKGCYLSGVSTDLNVSYLASVGVGETITIESSCTKLGQTLAFTTTDIKHGDTLLAQGRHTKYVAQAWAVQEKMAQEGRLMSLL
jgi:acyl-coenzyme A thioesterase 13